MKKLIVFAAILVSAVTSQAAYLWWQIDNPQGTTEQWATAKLYQRNIDGTGEMQELGDLDLIEEGKSALDWSEVSQNDTYAYYIELLSSDGNLVGYTKDWQSMTYAKLVGDGAITETLDVPPAAGKAFGAAPGGYNAPEPTSAMLMLLGVAGLALKRKQKKA